ncbi:3-coathanger stack domain-containing protein [Chryseobacterium sp. SIMBA_038]|uniref:3-coathanger stack domain-containing protein n=2 Tax=unclassified Chryseobacterium TaxID=2593645 RepID=UPI00397C3D13
MKTKISFIAFLIALSTNFLSAQHENDNWLFGNSKWRFDNTAPNGFTHTTNVTPAIRYTSSVISDKNTGELLFSCNGYSVYNKNGVIMDNGNEMFGASNTTYQYQSFGNPSDQSSIILPVPGSGSLYYVFYINGNRYMNDQIYVQALNPTTNYGLRYAIVDMSLNGGLGKVISKNNILFTNSGTNALTSTFASDGSSYWIVTANNGNYLSYKLDSNGLNTAPVVSPGVNLGSFIKISPNAKKLLTREYKSVWLYDFNNTTGSVTSPFNIIPNDNFAGYYDDDSGGPNSAEFSPDSNIVYFISAGANLCLYPTCIGNISWSGLSMYNISTASLVGVENTSIHYKFSLNGLTVGMQRAKNGKIYLIYNALLNDTEGYGYKEVIFGNTIPNTSNFISYDWGVINTPNVWSPAVSPLTTITPQKGTRNGFSFPQLIPTSDGSNPCPDVLYITTPVTSSQVFQAGKSIFASSTINDNLSVEYKAGLNVNLNPGFFVKGDLRGNFKAYIRPCTIASFNNVGPNNIEPTFAKTSTIVASEVKIYPNPASTVVKIDAGKNKLMGWTLYDLSGKNILNGNDLSVPVENLPKSAYLLMIKLDNGTTVTKKIIVQ